MTIIAYKGFDKELKCRDFQYEIGGIYEHNGSVVRCTSDGFHACENPLDVLRYYPPTSRFAIVECGGDIDREFVSDTKFACGRIKIKKEITLTDIVTKGVDFILSKADTNSASTSTGTYSASTSTGCRSVSTSTGYRSVSTNTGIYSFSISTGYRSVSTSTGYRSVSTSTGDCSVSTSTGNHSVSTSTGRRSASISTSNHSFSISTGNLSTSTSTGKYSTSTSTGDCSVSTSTGDFSVSEVVGSGSLAVSTGSSSKAKASVGSAIVLAYRNDDGDIIKVLTGIAGIDIEPDVYYTVSVDGELIKAEDL